MQVKIKILGIAALLSSFAACSNEGGGDQTNPSLNNTYIRFVSPSGTNVLDSLGITMKEKLRVAVTDNRITVTGKRTSDGTPLEFLNEWEWASPIYEPKFKEEKGTVLHLFWVDHKTWNIEKRSNSYDENYAIQLSSPEVFGNNEVHTLNWHVKVKGRTHDAYKCELDGKEVSLSDDPFYNWHVTYDLHQVAAEVTIICK